MSNEDIDKILADRGVRPTANRILVLKELIKSTRPISLADLEMMLYPMDKASIFRVLELFSEKEMLHVIEDGSRSLKYEYCHSEGSHSVSDQHAHFYCEKCGRLICLEQTSLPELQVPEGCVVKGVNFMIKGICAECAKG